MIKRKIMITIQIWTTVKGRKTIWLAKQSEDKGIMQSYSTQGRKIITKAMIIKNIKQGNYFKLTARPNSILSWKTAIFLYEYQIEEDPEIIIKAIEN